MPIEFEAIRNKLEADRSAIISETVELFSGIIEDNEKGKIEDLDNRVEHGKSILQDFLNIGSLIEFLDQEEKSIRDYLEEKEIAITAKLEHAGVDLTGIVESKEAVKEPETHTQAELTEEEAEENKRRGIERIRKNLGNVEAFKTGNVEVDERLGEALSSYWGIGLSRIAGFRERFGEDDVPTIADFLSHTQGELSTFGSL